MTQDAYFTLTDPQRRARRFYRLVLTQDLFGRWCLWREWGRRGSPGRVRVDHYSTEQEAAAGAARIIRVRHQHGYQGAQH